MARASLALAALAALAVATPVQATGGAEPATMAPDVRFPVVFHVAEGVDVDRAFAERALAEAEALFAPAGFGFYVEDFRAVPATFALLDDVRERRALRRHFERRKINVFVVDRIMDPVASAATVRAAAREGRAPIGWLSGAHIPSGGRVPDTYLVLAARTRLWSLSHELGHFFGAPHHRDPANIMSYGVERRSFDERQYRTFRARGARYLRSRALHPARRDGEA